MGAPLAGLQNITPLSHPFLLKMGVLLGFRFHSLKRRIPRTSRLPFRSSFHKVSFTHGAVNEFPYWLYFRIVVLGS